MKKGTIEVVIKGACYAAIGAGTPMAASLSQWGDSGQWPPRIQWVIIGIGACVGGATQLLSFMSGSYTTYKANGNGNGNGQAAAAVTQPAQVKP